MGRTHCGEIGGRLLQDDSVLYEKLKRKRAETGLTLDELYDQEMGLTGKASTNFPKSCGSREVSPK